MSGLLQRPRIRWGKRKDSSSITNDDAPRLYRPRPSFRLVGAAMLPTFIVRETSQAKHHNAAAGSAAAGSAAAAAAAKAAAAAAAVAAGAAATSIARAFVNSGGCMSQMPFSASAMRLHPGRLGSRHAPSGVRSERGSMMGAPLAPVGPEMADVSCSARPTGGV
jgi:hypothetical protein